MKVLVVGGGGREHVICWKLKQDPRVTDLYCAPGNGGIASIATCVDIKATDLDSMVESRRSARSGYGRQNGRSRPQSIRPQGKCSDHRELQGFLQAAHEEVFDPYCKV